MDLTGVRIAVLAEKQFEDLELFYPLMRLREARASTLVVGLGATSYTGKHGLIVPVDATVEDVDPTTLDGLIIPGGWSPDYLRRDERILELVRQVDSRGRLLASICHGPWVMISANILRGRTLTGVVAVRDDLINAGASFVDQEVVVDGNLVTARTPRDIPAWSRAIVDHLASRHVSNRS